MPTPVAGKLGITAAVPVAVTVAVCAGLLLTLWASRTGPVQLKVGGRAPSYARVTPAPSPPPRHVQQQDHSPRQTNNVGPAPAWVREALWTVLLVLLLAGAVVCVRLRPSWMRRRRRRFRTALSHDGAAGSADEVTEELRATLEQESSAQLAALENGTARNAIVACWVGFEQSAGRIGLGPNLAQTPEEFLVGLLHAVDVDPRPASELAGLYHEARFSTHPMDESHRERARDLLTRLHDELGAQLAGLGTRS